MILDMCIRSISHTVPCRESSQYKYMEYVPGVVLAAWSQGKADKAGDVAKPADGGTEMSWPRVREEVAGRYPYQQLGRAGKSLP